MNTSYGLGGAFRAALEAGKTAAEAEQAEVDMLQFVYREPIAAQAHLMDTHNLGGAVWSHDQKAAGAEADEVGRRSVRRTVERLVELARILKAERAT